MKRGPEVTIHSGGYRMLWCPGHPDAHAGRVYEHRLVMEEKIGRPLVAGEQVHHRNGDKQDNRPENLELVDIREHPKLHAGETCGKGHRMDAANIYVRPDNGRRSCRACRRERHVRDAAARKAARHARGLNPKYLSRSGCGKILAGP